MPEPITPSATDTGAAETVETLKAQLAEATSERDKWKDLSRKNEDGKKANAEAAKQAAELQARLDALESAKMTDAEKTAKRIADLEAAIKTSEERAASATLAALKARIGSEKGLPSALIDRLQGEDEDSIAADADALLASIPQDVKSAWPELGQGSGAAQNTVADPLEAALRGKLGIPT